MRKMLIPAVLACAILMLFTSCTTLRTATPVKAAFDGPAKSGSMPEEPSWAGKYIPGARALSNAWPQPSAARVQWDDWYKRKNERWSSETGTNLP